MPITRRAQRAAFATLWNATHPGLEPPPRLERGQSDAPLLSPGRGFVSAFDWTMQLQVGCPGGCLFCYVPASRRLTPASVRGPDGSRWGWIVRDKRRVRARLTRRLEKGELADCSVYWSGVSDPYAAPPEATRAVWESLLSAHPQQRPRTVVIQTRFAIDRDLQLIERYLASSSAAPSPPVVASISMGTDREDLIRSWERATPPFARRLCAIRRLRQAGVPTVATLSPMGPWQDLGGCLELLRAWGVMLVTGLFFKPSTGPTRTPPRFLELLAERWPEVLDASWQAEQAERIAAVFGERAIIGQPGFAALAAAEQRVPQWRELPQPRGGNEPRTSQGNRRHPPAPRSCAGTAIPRVPPGTISPNRVSNRHRGNHPRAPAP